MQQTPPVNECQVLKLKLYSTYCCVYVHNVMLQAGLIEKEVAEAQIKAQLAALEEEKEVVHRQRLSAELLTQLTEKVSTHHDGLHGQVHCMTENL